jgi:predicted naringenin-chalcone synthase
LSKIINIATAVPPHKHSQEDILQFMQCVYALDAVGNRKLKFLYHHSSIDSRYSVIPDYSRSLPDWTFYPQSENLEPFPSLEMRMQWFNKFAPELSVNAIKNCIEETSINKNDITHLITVSCTGMSAPGLDLQVMELLDLPNNIFRTSVNFMGCYAAIHALKLADSICIADEQAKVMIVCTELCTLHFQRESDPNNIAASLLFADGAAAAMVTGNSYKEEGLLIDGFYSEVLSKGKNDMSWELSSKGFLMTLSGYVPDLIEEDFDALVSRAMKHYNAEKTQVNEWCIHPGGKRILEAIHKSLDLPENALQDSYNVLREYGNMSSATILFVLKDIMKKRLETKDDCKIFGAAFGPGLTMETMFLETERRSS